MLDFYEKRLQNYNVAKIIYGTIIILVVILAMEDHPPSPAGAVATVLFAGMGVALAELYSEIIGIRIREKRATTMREKYTVMRHVATVLAGALLPLPYFILAWLGIMREETAFLFARWTLVGVLLFYGYIASRVSGYNIKYSIVYAVAACTIGLFVVFFKDQFGH